jgi:bacillithiol biosynthesis deacetylase BshB1
MVDILAIGVHPDDVELSCSGTVIKLVEKGYTLGMVDLTKGELGTRGTPELRVKEAEDAAKILGAKYRTNLGMKDGLFEINEENLLKIVVEIRKSKAAIVFANAIKDRHPDHGRAAKLVSQACFLAGLRKIKTTHENKVQKAWRPKNVFHYIQDRYHEPDFIFDITGTLPKKMEAIMAFKSQFYDPDSPEPSSPISGKDFLEFLEGRARQFGREAGFEHGEGFTSAKKIGVKDVFDLG